jgi:hypothetical protein
MKKRLFLLSLALLGILMLAGCAAGANPAVDIPNNEGESDGFWSGLWHGLISPITFIISIFSDNVNIYEVHNTGNWYDFGFMLGICMVFSGGAGGAARASKR